MTLFYEYFLGMAGTLAWFLTFPAIYEVHERHTADDLNHISVHSLSMIQSAYVKMVPTYKRF